MHAWLLGKKGAESVDQGRAEASMGCEVAVWKIASRPTVAATSSGMSSPTRSAIAAILAAKGSLAVQRAPNLFEARTR